MIKKTTRRHQSSTETARSVSNITSRHVGDNMACGWKNDSKCLWQFLLWVTETTLFCASRNPLLSSFGVLPLDMNYNMARFSPHGRVGAGRQVSLHCTRTYSSERSTHATTSHTFQRINKGLKNKPRFYMPFTWGD